MAFATAKIKQELCMDEAPLPPVIHHKSILKKGPPKPLMQIDEAPALHTAAYPSPVHSAVAQRHAPNHEPNQANRPEMQVDEVPSSHAAAYPSIVSSAAAPHHKPNETHHKPNDNLVATRPHHQVHPSSLIFFSSHDTLKLDFPIGCPVCYNLDKEEFDQGMVVDVALDCATRKYVYKIEKTALVGALDDPKDMFSVFDLVAEEDLLFGMNCPVKVEIANTEIVGLVVGPNGVIHGDNSSRYMILTTTKEGRTRLLRGVKSIKIKYHSKESANNEVATSTMRKPQQKENSASILREIRDDRVPNASNKAPSLPTTVDSSSFLDTSQSEFSQQPVTSNKRKVLTLKDMNNEDSNHCDKKQCISGEPSFTIRLVVPSWVLKCKKDLLGTLEASKPDIVAKAKGFIATKTAPDGLAICIVSKDGAAVGIINREVTKLLVSCLDDDGSAGRLLFELAKSGSGSYRIPNSPTGAVKQRSIFDANREVWMHLVEVPSVLYEARKDGLSFGLQNIRKCYAPTQIHLGVSKKFLNQHQTAP